ncbi:cupredoxin domain-containing protein [Leisingera sp. ANG-Vp]|uniref:cupredoxin domain-containing protein n=1 Tax=Leisingera sp. ANG-Vp TaxID=1577896 RepID=UPI00057CB4F1|nr:cupredoxin family copper-binding protein [Leisingera sp. ANG-Vp]KIC22798.1 hypothetical protein RA20_00095 [Leisingera sp. ANG-Vp]
MRLNRRGFGLSLTAAAMLQAGQGRAAGAEHAVTIRRFTFSPAELVIRPGDRVVWENRDSAPHTATGRDGGWDTGEIVKGAQAGVVFEREGRFEYLCAYHPHMTAVVTVRR